MCCGRRREVSTSAGQHRALMLSGPPGGECPRSAAHPSAARACRVRGGRGGGPGPARSAAAAGEKPDGRYRPATGGRSAERAERARDGRANPTATRPRTPTRQPTPPGAGCPAKRDNSEPSSALLHASGLCASQRNPDGLPNGQGPPELMACLFSPIGDRMKATRRSRGSRSRSPWAESGACGVRTLIPPALGFLVREVEAAVRPDRSQDEVSGCVPGH